MSKKPSLSISTTPKDLVSSDPLPKGNFVRNWPFPLFK
jgi:hypothetical protein